MRDRRVGRRSAGLTDPGGGGRTLALALAVAVVALSVFSVSHIHGISDPHTPHHLLDLVFFAQAHTGFLIAAPLCILVALTTIEKVLRLPQPAPPSYVAYTGKSRAPPSQP